MSTSYDPEHYWDEVAQNIAARKDTRIIAGDDEPYYRYKRKRFLQLLDTISFKDREVLEIGSGPGGNLAFIYARQPKRLAGADISPRMVQLARENLQGKEVEVTRINGQELPFNNSSFDIVFTSTVLQHNTNEKVLQQLVGEIARVSRDEVLLFERIEKRIKGHETNLGRPVAYYADLLKAHGFILHSTQALPLQASYYVCGAIRKIFNPASRKEGESLTRLSIFLERITLPITSLLDKLIPSNRDVMLLRFKKVIK